MMKWQTFSDADVLASAACQFILDTAARAISQQQGFSIALSGGRTPKLMNSKLALAKADWQYWNIFYADERCLPTDSVERNSRMTMTSWLEHIPLAASQHHPIHAELGPEQAASLYSKELSEYLPLDLVVLGMGEDGHTASLFPGHEHESEAVVVAVNNAPKPPPQRVSLSYASISAAHDRLVLVTGEDKAQVVAEWYKGAPLPITLATHSGATVYLDEAAASLIPG